ncbi:MAG: hypothetical protein H8D92_00105 [Pelagibacteraceae bacterium]|nr:hypothetical protein [Pelagibacteraceae bacterium]
MNTLTEKESFVYCLTNHTKGYKYVGYHKGNEDDGYVCSSKSDRFWADYKTDNFSRQIIAKGSVEDMVSLERKILENIDLKSDEWYNDNVAGAIVMTEAIRKKISESHKTRTHYWTPTEEHKKKMSLMFRGVPKTEAHKQAMRDNHADVSGENNPMYGKAGFGGKKHSEETKKKMSLSMSGRIRTAEHRLNLSKAKKGKPSMIKGHKYETRICPHCGVQGGGGNMTRHHFDNCREL